MGTRALTILAIVLPWLALLPIANAAVAVALFACALLAAFHGWGLILDRNADATRAIQWGIGVVVGLAGLAIALHLYAPAAIVYTGVAIHTAVLLLRLALSSFGPVPPLRIAWYGVPGVALAVLGAVAVLGGAGDLAGRSFDDDGNLLGALRELADTGTSTVPHAFQLGAHAALAGLTNLVDARLLRVIDALAFVTALAYAIARIRPRDAHGALIATLLVLAGSALALAISDPIPLWLGVGLVLAVLDDTAPPLATGVVAGALIALRHAYAPLAIVALVRRPRAAISALIVVAPYLVTALRTHGTEPASTGFGKLGIAVGVAIVALPFAVLILRDWRGLAVAAAMGGIAAQLTGDHGLRYAWAIAIAAAILLAVDVAHRPLGTRAMLLVLVLGLITYEGQEATGRSGWYRRTSDLVDGIGLLARAPLAPPRDLDAILAEVPADALVALYVPEPWRFDHARHKLVDIRAPRIRADHAIATLRPRYVVFTWEDPPKLKSPLSAITVRDGMALARLAK